MLEESDLGTHEFATPEAAVGSRFAGIPGYVIQSDLLKPIANTLSVRDDTFRIRAYGDVASTRVAMSSPGHGARRSCSGFPSIPMAATVRKFPRAKLSPDGEFSSIDDSELTPANRRFGRKFQIESFRWLSGSEI